MLKRDKETSYHPYLETVGVLTTRIYSNKELVVGFDVHVVPSYDKHAATAFHDVVNLIWFCNGRTFEGESKVCHLLIANSLVKRRGRRIIGQKAHMIQMTHVIALKQRIGRVSVLSWQCIWLIVLILLWLIRDVEMGAMGCLDCDNKALIVLLRRCVGILTVFLIP